MDVPQTGRERVGQSFLHRKEWRLEKVEAPSEDPESKFWKTLAHYKAKKPRTWIFWEVSNALEVRYDELSKKVYVPEKTRTSNSRRSAMRSAYIVPDVLDDEEDNSVYNYSVNFQNKENIYILNGGSPPVRVMRTYQLEHGDNYTMEKQWFRGVLGESKIVEDRGLVQEYAKIRVTHLKCTPDMASSLGGHEEESEDNGSSSVRWFRLPEEKNMAVRFTDIRLCSQSSKKEWDPVSTRQFPPKEGDEVAVWVDAHDGLPVRPMIARSEEEVKPYWIVATSLNNMMRDHMQNPEIRSKCYNYLSIMKEYLLTPANTAKLDALLLPEQKWRERVQLDMANSTTSLSEEIASIFSDENNRKVWRWIPDGEWLYHVQKKSTEDDIALFVLASDLDTSEVMFALHRNYVRLTAQSISRRFFGATAWPFPPFQKNQKVRYNNKVWVVQEMLDETGSFGGYKNIPKYVLAPQGQSSNETVLGALIYGEEPDKTSRCVAHFKQIGNDESQQSEPMVEVYKSGSAVDALGRLEMSNGTSMNPTLVEIVHNPPTFVKGDHVVLRIQKTTYDMQGYDDEISTFLPTKIEYVAKYTNNTNKTTTYTYKLANGQYAKKENLRLHRGRPNYECESPPSPADGPRFDYDETLYLSGGVAQSPTVNWDHFRNVTVARPYDHPDFIIRFFTGFDSPLYLCTRPDDKSKYLRARK